MSFVYLVGGGYCERCKRICENRRKRARKTKIVKPAYLKYVRYHPTATVTPGWDGSDSPVVVPRVPTVWDYNRTAANRLRSVMATPKVPAMPATVVAVSNPRKRKASD